MRVLLTLSYDGTDFYGYQVQPNKRTVEEVLNNSIFLITGERVKSIASGRTDSGVHAKGQMVHFDTNCNIPAKNFANALNSVLPNDVRVLKSKKVSNDFHARYDAKKKTYVYSLYQGNCEEPLKDRYSVYLKQKIDLSKMLQAGEKIQGTHDFKCFLSSGSSVKDTVRSIYSLTITKRGKDIQIKITGNGFLYNMVRIIVGTLVSVGEGKLSVADVEKALNNGNRKGLGKTMPARGLCLYSVNYT